MLNSLSQDQEIETQRELRIVFSASHKLGIFTDAIDTIVDWRIPTPLPSAPKPVLGVVSLHGSMRTVLDVAELIGESTSAEPKRLVSLRGSEQLALAVDGTGETVSMPLDRLAKFSSEPSLILGVLADGDGVISVLDTNQLFATAMRGHERRHRRF